MELEINLHHLVVVTGLPELSHLGEQRLQVSENLFREGLLRDCLFYGVALEQDSQGVGLLYGSRTQPGNERSSVGEDAAIPLS